MEKHPYLTKAEKILKDHYYCEWRHSNILELSSNESSVPFAYLTIEPEQFEGIVISLGADFTDAFLSADLAISLMHVAPVAMGESFYINNGGSVLWGEEAQKQYILESNSEFNKLKPLNNTVH